MFSPAEILPLVAASVARGVSQGRRAAKASVSDLGGVQFVPEFDYWKQR